jgi:Ca2+-binding EF-hand superfamily protein
MCTRQDFDLFDADRDGYIVADELAWILRLAGYCPTIADCEDACAQHGDTGDEAGKIDFNTVQRIAQALPKADRTHSARAELMESMRTFDVDDTGLIPENDLRNVLTAMGESLRSDEAYELIHIVGVDGDYKVDLSKFADMLLSS